MEKLKLEEYQCIPLTKNEANETEGGLFTALFVFGLVVGAIIALWFPPEK